MMFMTAKVDIKKIAIAVIAVIAVIAALVMLFGGSADAAPSNAAANAAAVSGNDARIEFLKGFGWEVSDTPTESGQVRIPQAATDVFDRYNALQKSQGYDLSKYAGKTVMRYVYQINNYPGATDPVYATLLVYKNQIIGGDVTNTSAKGAVSGFQKPAQEDAQGEPTTQPVTEGTTAPAA